MPKKPKCEICEILRLQNLAFTKGKKRYQVTRYLELGEAAHQRILNSTDLNKTFFCSDRHEEMAEAIIDNHLKLQRLLLGLSEESIRQINKQVADLAIKYAEALILCGASSMESVEALDLLVRQKRLLTMRRKERERIVQ